MRLGSCDHPQMPDGYQEAVTLRVKVSAERAQPGCSGGEPQAELTGADLGLPAESTGLVPRCGAAGAPGAPPPTALCVAPLRRHL